MISPEDLLEPISPDKPCGEDPASNPDFFQLQVLLRGKPETMLSKEGDKAEEPNWAEVETLCLKLFEGSKHLRVAVALSLAWLKSKGLTGFRDGLVLTRSLLENYWEPIYPLLEAEYDNDPTERLNILASFCAPPATEGDPMQFALRLHQASLCPSLKASISTSDIIRAEANDPEARSLAEIQAAFTKAAPADIQTTHQVLAEILVHINEMDATLARVVGPAYTLSWTGLIDVIENMQSRLARYAPESTGQAEASAAAPADAQTMSNEQEPRGATASMVGDVQSRRDVSRAIDSICGYYSRFEPSSPIPLLLRRAQRLVDKDFMAIVNDLTPEALGQLKVIVGEQVSSTNEER